MLALLFVWSDSTQHWSLQAVVWGQVLMPKWWLPGEFTLMNIPQYLCHQCPFPHSEPQPPPSSPGDPPSPAVRSGPGLYEVTGFALVSSMHETLCAPSKRGVSVFPSFVELVQSSPADLQSQMLWGLLLPFLDS